MADLYDQMPWLKTYPKWFPKLLVPASQSILDEGINREHIELMYFFEFSHQLVRSDAVSHFPSRCMIGFPKGADHETSPGQFRIPGHALVPKAVKNNVLIDLIGKDENGSIFNNVYQRRHVFTG